MESTYIAQVLVRQAQLFVIIHLLRQPSPESPTFNDGHCCSGARVLVEHFRNVDAEESFGIRQLIEIYQISNFRVGARIEVYPHGQSEESPGFTGTPTPHLVSIYDDMGSAF